MTVEEVLGAFPGEAVRLPDAPAAFEEDLVPGAVIESALVGTRPFSVGFQFDAAGRLARIRMRPVRAADESLGAYEELSRLLAEEHGPPASTAEDSSPAGSWVRESVWRRPGGILELRASELRAGDARIFAVNIRKRDVRPAGERLLLLTYRRAPAGAEP
jgi:hypothetical protein